MQRPNETRYGSGTYAVLIFNTGRFEKRDYVGGVVDRFESYVDSLLSTTAGREFNDNGVKVIIS